MDMCRLFHVVISIQADWMMQLCLRIILRADTEEVVSAMCDHNNQSEEIH